MRERGEEERKREKDSVCVRRGYQRMKEGRGGGGGER
jgi:hypothetical protein